MSLKSEFKIGIAQREVAFGQDCKALVAAEGIDPSFLAYAIQGRSVQILGMVDEASHGTGRLQTEPLEQLEILVPPLNEQHRIVGVLSAIDDKIEHNDLLARKLDSLIALRYKNLIAEAETSWRNVEIGEAVRVAGGSTPSTKEPSYWHGDIAFVTPKDLAGLDVPVLSHTERRITRDGLSQISSGLLSGSKTVLLSSRAPIGYVARPTMDVCVNQGFIAMVCEEEVGPNFVMQWARDNVELFKSRANGTTFLEISKRSFRPIPISLPPADELRSFEADAERSFALMASLVEESMRLTALRNLLLPALVIGEIRVPQTSDPVTAAVAEGLAAATVAA